VVGGAEVGYVEAHEASSSSHTLFEVTRVISVNTPRVLLRLIIQVVVVVGCGVLAGQAMPGTVRELQLEMVRSNLCVTVGLSCYSMCVTQLAGGP
jgi:hypothetical protein